MTAATFPPIDADDDDVPADIAASRAALLHQLTGWLR